MESLNLTDAQKKEIGRRMKYLGGNVLDLHPYILSDLNQIYSLFTLSPEGKKDDRSETLTCHLEYDESELNWVAKDLPKPSIFYRYLDLINEMGVLDSSYCYVRVHIVNAMKLAGTVIPKPDSRVGSRIVFNL